MGLSKVNANFNNKYLKITNIMRYIAAYMLAALGGNESPSKDDLEKILGSVAIKADSARLDLIIKELKGKNLETLIAEGMSKLASVPSGGGAAAAGGGGGAAADAPAEEKKEEKKPESSEDEDSDEGMGFGLFDD